jgi:hypothetical protein
VNICAQRAEDLYHRARDVLGVSPRLVALRRALETSGGEDLYHDAHGVLADLAPRFAALRQAVDACEAAPEMERPRGHLQRLRIPYALRGPIVVAGAGVIGGAAATAGAWGFAAIVEALRRRSR